MAPIKRITPFERYASYLRFRGKAFTRERQRVLTAVFDCAEPFGAEDIVRALEGAKVSRSTVYRTLSHLVEANLVRKLPLSDRTLFEPI